MPLPSLIAGLLRPAAYPHPAAVPTLIETHISWVILAGEYAYKIKKPLALGFLDFSSLERRRHFCDEEIRLNRRLAPEIYLAVVAVTGSEHAPRLGGEGDVLEYAVQMRAFPVNATLDREETISAAQIDAIAKEIAVFHAAIPPAPDPSFYGLPAQVVAPVSANFAALRPLLPLAENPELRLQFERLQSWSEAEGRRLCPHFTMRRAAGMVRECHGDLHLGNIAWVKGRALVFDALEFNPALRFIDVASELAFLSMDLRHRGRADLAWRLVNRYLEESGDFPGLAAFTYYQVYRATVRAKVTAILASEKPDQAAEHLATAESYLQLADELTHERRPQLILMHGLSGSGKTWLSQQLLEQLGAIRLRSDVLRKRLFGLPPLAVSGTVAGGIYTPEGDQRTLAALLDTGRSLLAAGFAVIVDATFLRRSWREPFQRLAGELAVTWQIVAVTAPPAVLRARLAARQREKSDASEAGLAVLAGQEVGQESFIREEEAHILPLDTSSTTEREVGELVARLASLGQPPAP
jgi:uncharacterized protein